MRGITVFIVFILFLVAGQAAAQEGGPSLIVTVNATSSNPGDQVVVDLVVVNMQDMFALQTQCVVDPNVLTGIKPADGDIFNAGNSFFVDKGFQADGRWTVATSLLQPNLPFSGSAIAYRLTYQIKAIGSSTIACNPLAVDIRGQPLPIIIVNGVFNNAPLPPTQPPQPTVEATPVPIPTAEPTLLPEQTAEPTPITEVTVEPTPEVMLPVMTDQPGALAIIQGVFTYQNHPDDSGIIVQLLSPDSSELARLITGADGAYQFTDVPLGSYGVTAVGIHHLQIAKIVEITTPGQVVDLGTLMLLGGDTDGNGAIDVADAALIGINFELTVNPAPAEADVNLDGLVNVRDLAIVGGNFGLMAPVVVQ